MQRSRGTGVPPIRPMQRMAGQQTRPTHCTGPRHPTAQPGQHGRSRRDLTYSRGNYAAHHGSHSRCRRQNSVAFPAHRGQGRPTFRQRTIRATGLARLIEHARPPLTGVILEKIPVAAVRQRRVSRPIRPARIGGRCDHRVIQSAVGLHPACGEIVKGLASQFQVSSAVIGRRLQLFPAPERTLRRFVGHHQCAAHARAFHRRDILGNPFR